MGWCGGVCKVSNAVRLFHVLLTLFILYVLLTNPHSGKVVTFPTQLSLCPPDMFALFSELNKAWRSKDMSFFVLISLLSVSLLLYLIASLVDPGYLPKVEPSLLDFTTTNKVR